MKLYTVPGKYDIFFKTEVLGKTVASYMAEAFCCELSCELPDGETYIAAYMPVIARACTVLTEGSIKIGEETAAEVILPEGCPSECCTELKDAFIIRSMRDVLRFQDELRMAVCDKLLENDVFIQNPANTYISPDAVIDHGAVILEGTHIYGKSLIGTGCKIGPNSIIKDCIIGNNVTVNASQTNESFIGDETTVGPFAYIRPGCKVGKKVKIGDFVELKKAVIGDGTKLSHLTYMGDAELGKNINIGCGVVAVNYDGRNKHKTKIADNSFIGCNVNLVAPVEIGEGAYVAAGSTITEYVEPEALAIARSRQTVKPGWMKNRPDLKK